jgi:mRNA interferase RelE/StbE
VSSEPERYVLRYHPAVVAEDLAVLPANLRSRVLQAIGSRLSSSPQRYGLPLRGTLHGYWKLRVGDYRVVFKVSRREVWILAVLHRKKVYGMVGRRMSGETGARQLP